MLFNSPFLVPVYCQFEDTASPNAALALRLQLSPSYQILPLTYSEAWLAECVKLLSDIDLLIGEQLFPELQRRNDAKALCSLVAHRVIMVR